MGGAAEFPDRASSPLKRRASSMDPDEIPQDPESQDVDMVSAPLSPPNADDGAHGAHSGEQGSRQTTEAHEDSGRDENAAQDTPMTLALASPESIEAHIKSIRTLVKEMATSELEENQEGYIVSRQWLDKVLPDVNSSKLDIGEPSSIDPVDNSDIILEIIRDPCVGNGVESPMKKNFVRLKPGCDTSQLEIFPKEAWNLLMQWPGLHADQHPIVRYAHNTSDDEYLPNVMFELHPPVYTVHRLWSANSPIAIDSGLKARNPAPFKLPRSRSTKLQTVFAQAKKVTNVSLSQKVRFWKVPKKPEAIGAAGPTPPASPEPDSLANEVQGPFSALLVDVQSFLALEKDVERILVEQPDHTGNPNYNGHITCGGIGGLTDDLSLVIDENIESNTFISNYSASRASATLPTRSSTTSLAVQDRGTKSARTSPAPQGPVTRGRTQRNGRTIGCVGLSNLGNTCYMNAALQCVRSVEELTKYFLAKEWKKELNKDNVLAHNGDVAATYAHLLEELYKESAPSSVTPRQFKNTIGRYAPSFSGYGQQDSQEFVGFLLDGLQEDLSRIKKKPYIEKPDSTDDMINDPEAIKEMAEKVWDITKKRDDSVIADLFTGLYKSTLVCPECHKISITFDPFNNLTLPLAVENKWNHTVKFFPLHDKPIDIRVEVDKHSSIMGVKEFISARVGVPADRIFGAEQWKDKFYKTYSDFNVASEEISGNDQAWFYELESIPTNCGGTKPQKSGVPVRSMLDDDQPSNSDGVEDPSERLLVPVLHRRPMKQQFGSKRRTVVSGPPTFIMVSRKEAESEDAIRRKILAQLAPISKHAAFLDSPESSDSDTTPDPDVVITTSSDGSSTDGQVAARSVQGEDDIVDVQMRDASELTASQAAGKGPRLAQFNRKKPSWISPDAFLPPQLQNAFELSYFTEPGAWIPTGQNGFHEERDYPRLSSRAPTETTPSEDQSDSGPNGAASNDSNSSDEMSREGTEANMTRMTQEESEEDEDQEISKPIPHRLKEPKIPKMNRKQQNGRKKFKPRQQKYGKVHKKALRQQHQHQQQMQRMSDEADHEDESGDSVPDEGALIRPKEAIIVDWSEAAYIEFLGDKLWEEQSILSDPGLDKAQSARSHRKKNGISIESCLDEFERDEILSENNQWYCPRCKEHRRANKKFDLWKTPDILVIHLKRFSSSGWRRDKIDVTVDFPLENLDITDRVLHKEDGKQEVYDLIGVDCHWGGLGGGHYTAHAKNFVDGQWYTYNDSSVSKATGNIVDSSAYLLFYRRRSDVPLGGPHFQEIIERFQGEPSDNELPGSGEDGRLDEGSSQAGSSSAFQGAGATRQAEGPGGSTLGMSTGQQGQGQPSNFDMDFDSVFQADDDIHQSIEPDEGVGMADVTKYRAFDNNPMAGTNSWNFSTVEHTNLEDGSSGPASDVAQHDRSSEERGPSPMFELDADLDQSIPGSGQYRLSGQTGPGLPTYDGEPQTNFMGTLGPDGGNIAWNQDSTVHEVTGGRDAADRESEEAAEIHISKNDELRL